MQEGQGRERPEVRALRCATAGSFLFGRATWSVQVLGSARLGPSLPGCCDRPAPGRGSAIVHRPSGASGEIRPDSCARLHTCDKGHGAAEARCLKRQVSVRHAPALRFCRATRASLPQRLQPCPARARSSRSCKPLRRLKLSCCLHPVVSAKTASGCAKKRARLLVQRRALCALLRRRRQDMASVRA